MIERGENSPQNPDRIVAPFTNEQVETLNLYQEQALFHPFTCAGKIHEQASPDLIATKEGWVCPDEKCDYTQLWAHSFMADRTYIESSIQLTQRYNSNK